MYSERVASVGRDYVVALVRGDAIGSRQVSEGMHFEVFEVFWRMAILWYSVALSSNRL